MTSDIFCQIIAGELPTAEVWRDDHVVAFLDHRPVFKGHVLVCPTTHVGTLLELPDEELVPLFATTRAIAAAMTPAFGAEGTFVAMNNVVSQSVPHLHVHVVPRTKGDGLRGFFWPRTHYSPGEEMEHAERLRGALSGGS